MNTAVMKTALMNANAADINYISTNSSTKYQPNINQFVN